MLVFHLDDAEAFVTLDGSTIRELCCRAPGHTDDDTILTGA